MQLDLEPNLYLKADLKFQVLLLHPQAMSNLNLQAYRL